MTVFSGGEAIRKILEEFDNWLAESVAMYHLRGDLCVFGDGFCDKPARQRYEWS